MNNRLFKIGIAGFYIAAGACTEFAYALDTMFDDAVRVQSKYEREKARVNRRAAPVAPQKEKVEPAYIKDWKQRTKERQWQAYQNRQARRNANREARRADPSVQGLSWWDRFWGKKPQKIEQPKIAQEPAPKDTASTAISYDFCNVKVQLMFGDIAEQADVDAIVNAANPQLSDGLGVTGAIWKAAGPQLDEYIEKNVPVDKDGERLKTGLARWTSGFKLKAGRIIHAVGPRGDNPNRQELLKSVYRAIFDLYFSEGWDKLVRTCAVYHGGDPKKKAQLGYRVYKTIAIPMISTGIYGYPREEATQIAVNEVVAWAKANPNKEVTVRFVFFDDENGRASFELYKKLFGQASSSFSSKDCVKPTKNEQCDKKQMSYVMCNTKIELVFGKIEEQQNVDVIVENMVDVPQPSENMHDIAGPELREYINKWFKDKKGFANHVYETPGFGLGAQRILFVVSPRGRDLNFESELRIAYKNLFYSYLDHGSKPHHVIALPMLGRGIFWQAREEAARVAVDEAIGLATDTSYDPGVLHFTIRFVFPDDENGRASFELYKKLLNQACAERN